jgi:hypothetical protein
MVSPNYSFEYIWLNEILGSSHTRTAIPKSSYWDIAWEEYCQQKSLFKGHFLQQRANRSAIEF